jgi:phage terminase large subunit-like protein
VNNPAEENKFRNLYLNQWTEQAVRWIPMANWDACTDEGLTIDDFSGESCWAGLDLASTRDINALSLLFRRDDVFYCFPVFWMPREPIDIRSKQDKAQAKRWAEKGLIRQTDGDVTDYGVIAADIMELSERFHIEKLAYDPWGPARALAQMLIGMGMYAASIEEFRQVIGNFAAPSKEFERRVASGTLRHSGDPVMRWMVSNVAADRDKNDNIRPSKSMSADKIDGVVATLMALGLLLERENASVYESTGGLGL